MSTPNLKEFLQKNGVFKKFCQNLKNNKGSNALKTFDEFTEHQKEMRNEADGGLFAFIWAETPENEGFYFWNEVDTRWHKYYHATMNDGEL